MLRPQSNKQVVNGKYNLIKQVGRGVASTIWLAHDSATQNPVAIKFPSDTTRIEKWRKVLNREANNTGCTNHRNVVSMIEYDDQAPCIVLEWLNGNTLADAIINRRTISLPYILKLLKDTCMGLHIVHSRNVAHRDVKPSNIMVVRRRAVLIDFGLSRKIDDYESSKSDRPIGTPRYMAPELIRKDNRIDLKQCDLYSLGAAFYEAFTGSPPFRGYTAIEVFDQHVSDVLELPSSRKPGLPLAIDALLEQALTKQPQHRYRSAMQFYRAASAVLKAL